MASDTQIRGQEAEFLAAFELARLGYEISLPVTNSAHDLIATKGGEVMRVQVKTIRRRGHHIVIDCTDGAGQRYQAGAVDMFAGYDARERRVYFVSAEQLGERREIWIDPRKIYQL